MSDRWDEEEFVEEDDDGAEATELTAEEEAELEDERLASERRYFNASRSHSAGLLAILPLLAIYEIGMMGFGGDVNAVADAIKTPISWLRRHPAEILGVNAMLLVNGVAIAAVLGAVWRLGRRGALHAGTFLGMFLEGCAYALLLGPLALFPLTGQFEFTGFVPHTGHFWTKLVISCGAGAYEEVLFRFIVLGAVFYLAKELLALRSGAAGVLALFVSGVLFSAAHFISPGETAEWGTFVYRLVAGMALGFIFLTRGLGIAAWTHALYDVYVLCFAEM